MRVKLQAVCGALAAFCALAGAAGAQGFGAPNSGIGVGAMNGEVFVLQSGDSVRLAGIGAPAESAPMADAARAGLDDLVADEAVSLTFDEERRDRRGRLVAHVYVGEEGEPVWAQEDMLRAGLAWVETTPATASMAAIMLPIEAEARAAGRGLWAAPDFAVLDPDPHALAQRLDTFQIVEGIVVDAAQTEDFVYLNFGLDYRTDFTVSIARRDLDTVEAGGLDPLTLEGARIRVRGYVHAVNGPMIDVDHAAQVEVLD